MEGDGERRGAPAHAATDRLFFLVWPSVILPSFLGIIDQTIVASALPTIAGALGDVERISWIVIAYLLATTVSAPIYGFFGDLIGRRTLMIVALAVFMLASIACALAPNVLVLTLARAAQGAGGGGLLSLSQALIGEVIPARERARYQGYFATVGVSAQAFGPVAGGFLTQHFGWPAIFAINVPFGLLAVALVLRLPARRPEPRTGWRFDGGGLFFFVAFVIPTLLALEQMQRLDPRALPVAAILIAVAVVAFVLLLRQEARARSPLLPIDLYRRADFGLANLGAFCHGAAFVSLLSFVPIYLRVVHGASASQIGLLLLPVSAGVAFGSMLCGRLITRTGYTLVFPGVALIFATATLLLFALVGSRIGATATSVLLGVNSAFMGFVMPAVQITIQVSAGSARLGSSAAAIQISRSVGSALGVTLFSVALFGSLLWRDPQAAEIFGRIVDAGPDVIDSLASATRTTVQGEIADAFQFAFLLPALFAAIGCASTWLNPSRRI